MIDEDKDVEKLIEKMKKSLRDKPWIMEVKGLVEKTGISDEAPFQVQVVVTRKKERFIDV